MLFVLIALISLLCQFFLPWWIIAPIAFGLSAWKATRSGHAFKSAFWAIFLVWVIMSTVKSVPNGNALANRVSHLFMLPQGYNWILVMVLITGIIGGLVAGFAAMAGFLCRKAVQTTKKQDS